MEINLPDVAEEVRTAFMAYEKALVTNDVEALDRFFWADDKVLRYGLAENLYGFKEIAAFRAGRPKIDLSRDLTRVVITTFGRDFATANCEYKRAQSGRLGRQSQTWARLPEGWRIVAAHVSWFQPPA
jgi:hypothetical protein